MCLPPLAIHDLKQNRSLSIAFMSQLSTLLHQQLHSTFFPFLKQCLTWHSEHPVLAILQTHFCIRYHIMLICCFWCYPLAQAPECTSFNDGLRCYNGVWHGALPAIEFIKKASSKIQHQVKHQMLV